MAAFVNRGRGERSELLTMFDPFLNHVSVSGGFPAHLQFRVTSESTSTVFGCGSTNRIGPTGDRGNREGCSLLCLSNKAAGQKGRSCSEEGGEEETQQRCVSSL